ncbi:peptidase inhibitor family I36 protein [Micromonospora rubida]
MAFSLVTTTALVIGVNIAPAQAADSAAGAATSASADVARILAANPGSRQLNASDVELEPGVIMSVPESRTADFGIQAGTCTYKYLCLWSGANWTGYKLSLTRCGWTYLQNYAWPNGGDWRDKTTSLVNNQTTGVISHFYDSDIYGNQLYLGPQHSYGYRANLAYDTAAVGGSWDERMDDILVC